MNSLDQAKDKLSKPKEQARDGIRKVANATNARADGKYSDQVDAGESRAKDALNGRGNP